MAQERFKIIPYVSLILRKDQEILLIRRSNTGYDDGFYACAGGGVDGNETMTDAIIREAQEELGIILKKEHLHVVHVLHNKHQNNVETVGFYIETTEWEGEPQNMEPHKHDFVGWFALDNLPTDTMSTLKQVIAMREKNVFYSELGW